MNERKYLVLGIKGFICASAGAIFLSSVVPANKALAIPEISTLRVDGYFDSIVPNSFLDPGTQADDIRYFFTFDATGNSKVFNTSLLQPGLLPDSSGFDELDSFIYSLTSWGIDFGQNGKIEGNKGEVFSDGFGVGDVSLNLKSDSFGAYLELNDFSAKGFDWNMRFDIGSNGFSETAFKWASVGNSSDFVIARDYHSTTSTTKFLKSVPEPASTLGLLALGVMGVASTRLKKSQS